MVGGDDVMDMGHVLGLMHVGVAPSTTIAGIEQGLLACYMTPACFLV
jgi:hypothetical protein